MMTVHEVSKISGVSIRALHHYDHIGLKAIGVKRMNFETFDTKKIDEYAAQAKASWGKTDAYKEYEQKSKGRSKEEQQNLHIRRFKR